MKIILFLLFMIMVVTSCTNSKSFKSKPNDVQREFIVDAKNIFKNKEIDYIYNSSYSSDDISFILGDKDITLDDFKIKIISEIKANGWFYLRRNGNSYVFCKDKKTQLEISPPKSLLGNIKAQNGDILRQLDNEWNIVFSKSKNIKRDCDEF